MTPDNSSETVIAKRGDVLLVVGAQAKASPVRDVYVIHQGIRCRIPVMFIKPIEED